MQTWSNDLNGAKSAILLLAAGSIIKHLWNKHVTQVCGSWAFCGNLLGFGMGSDVRLCVRGNMNECLRANACGDCFDPGVAPEWLGKRTPGGLYTSEDVSDISLSRCRRAWQRRVTGTTCSNCEQLFGHITSLPPFPSFPSLLVFTKGAPVPLRESVPFGEGCASVYRYLANIFRPSPIHLFKNQVFLVTVTIKQLIPRERYLKPCENRESFRSDFNYKKWMVIVFLFKGIKDLNGFMEPFKNEFELFVDYSSI